LTSKIVDNLTVYHFTPIVNHHHQYD